MAPKAKKRNRNDLILEYLRRETPGGESLCHLPPPHYYSGNSNTYPQRVLLRIKNKTVVMSSIEPSQVIRWDWFLAAPSPQANSSPSSPQCVRPEIPVVTVDIFRGLCQWLTQVAHCNFTLTVWENKQSCSDLFDVFCSCISTSSLPAGCDPY